METHIKVVGWLHLIMGAIACLGGLTTGGLLFMAGAIGGAAASVDGGAEVGLLAGGILGTIAMIFMVVMLIAALPGLLAGWGILSRKSWAPILASIVGLFHVMSIPFGTALAVYTWWTMLSKGGQAAYKT